MLRHALSEMFKIKIHILTRNFLQCKTIKNCQVPNVLDVLSLYNFSKITYGAIYYGAKCLWGKLSMGQNFLERFVHGAKCPWGVLSMGQIVHGASCPRSETTMGRNVRG
jgi:hypothetical protein